MSETITLPRFPAAKVALARETLNGLYEKLATAAAKTGATPPPMPSLEASAPETVVLCTACKATPVDQGFAPSVAASMVGKDCRSSACDGYYMEAKFVTLTVTAATPKLAGWEFLAAVEPLEGGNLVRRVPGSDDSVDLSVYRSGNALTCDHCNTDRRRLETFVVRADGSDPAVPAGAIKRVGRNCLSLFLGGKSPEWLLRGLVIEKALKELAEEGEGGGWYSGPSAYDPATAMAWACSTVRLRGWVSKGAATAYAEAGGGSKTTTADRVSSMLEGPPREPKARAEWVAEFEALKPTPADEEKATAVLEWAKHLAGDSDYEYSLSLVCKQPTLEPRNLGIFVSAVGSYDRAMGKAAAKAAEDALKTAAPLGKVEFEGEVIKVSVVTQRFGYNETSVDKMTVKVTTDAGIWFAWGTIPSALVESCVDGYDKYGDPSMNTGVLVGRKLKITATLEAGKDSHFVFMKRPKAEFADVYNHPVFKAPAKKRAKKVAEAVTE